MLSIKYRRVPELYWGESVKICDLKRNSFTVHDTVNTFLASCTEHQQPNGNVGELSRVMDDAPGAAATTLARVFNNLTPHCIRGCPSSLPSSSPITLITNHFAAGDALPVLLTCFPIIEISIDSRRAHRDLARSERALSLLMPGCTSHTSVLLSLTPCFEITPVATWERQSSR